MAWRKCWDKRVSVLFFRGDLNAIWKDSAPRGRASFGSSSARIRQCLSFISGPGLPNEVCGRFYAETVKLGFPDAIVHPFRLILKLVLWHGCVYQ